MMLMRSKPKLMITNRVFLFSTLDSKAMPLLKNILLIKRRFTLSTHMMIVESHLADPLLLTLVRDLVLVSGLSTVK